jgi:hypothetical protein
MASFDFSGIENAQTFERGKFFPPDGTFYLKVDKTLVKQTRKSGAGFIAEFIVLGSTHSDVNAGDKRSWFQKMADKDVAFPAIKEFMGALLGFSKDDKDEWKVFESKITGFLKEATDYEGKAEDHPLHGMTIKLTTWNKLTNNGKDFTVHDWEIWDEDDGIPA